jgi:hypothetical protein
MADAASEEVYKKLIDRSNTNTELYRNIFRCEPDDKQTSFDRLREDRQWYADLSQDQKMGIYQDNAPDIQGNVVSYPMYYMNDESLELSKTDFTNLVPKINFT